MTHATVADEDLTTGSTVVDEPAVERDVEHPSTGSPAVESGIRLPIALLLVGVLQTIVLAVAMSVVESLTVQLVIVADIVIGAIGSGIVAAADRRRLTAAGIEDAPPWAWAVVFPPAYLVFRAGALRSARASVALSPAALLQTLAAVTFLALAGVALANAHPFVSVAGTSRPVIGTDVARAVESSWSDSGANGSASCDNPAAQQEGTEVGCRGTYEGRPVAFVARLGAPAGSQTPVTVVRWSSR